MRFTSFAIIAVTVFAVSNLFFVGQAFAGIILLENLKKETHYVKAIGAGFFPANNNMSLSQQKMISKRTAQVDAYRNLLEKINSIKVESTTTIKDFSLQDDTVKSMVSGYLKGAEIVEVKYHEDYAEVEVGLKVGREFYDLVGNYLYKN